MITVTFKDSQTDKEVKAIIGSTAVTLMQIDAVTYSLVVPNAMAAGTYSVSLLNSSKTKSLTIKARKEVANPVQYNEAFLQQSKDVFAYMKATQDSLVKNGILTSTESAQTIDQLQAKLDEAQAKLLTATDAEKKQCAAFIDANRAQLDTVFTLLKTLGTLSLRNARVAQRFADEPVSYDQEIIQIGYTIHVLGPRLATLISMVAVAFLGGGPLAAVAVAATVVVAWNTFFATYNRFIAAVGFLDRTRKNLNLSVINGLKVAVGVSKTIVASLPVSNFQEDQQANSPNATYKAIVEMARSLREKLLNPVVQPFVKLTIPTVVPKLGQLPVEAASRLSVAVSNPNVKATVSDVKAGNVVMAFTTTQTTDQAFDVTLKYTYEGTEVAQTITGNTLQVAAPLTFRLTTPSGAPLTTPGTVNTAYTFTMAANGWVPKASTLITWNWGDGTSIDQVQGRASVMHTYSKQGTFPIRAWFATEDNPIYEAIASASIGEQKEVYYFQMNVNGTTYTFDPAKSFAGAVGGRFDIVGNIGQLQAGIFFAPASLLVPGPSINAFEYHCTATPDKPATYVLGSHLYSFATYKTLVTTYSLNSVWGCDPSPKPDNTTPGSLIITFNDGKTIEGTFDYTDYISKQPAQGKFRVPINK